MLVRSLGQEDPLEEEMVGWHHRHSGRESEHAPGGGEGQRSLACCGPRCHLGSVVAVWGLVVLQHVGS